MGKRGQGLPQDRENHQTKRKSREALTQRYPVSEPDEVKRGRLGGGSGHGQLREETIGAAGGCKRRQSRSRADSQAPRVDIDGEACGEGKNGLRARVSRTRPA